MPTLLNVVQSQIAWFACVLSAAAGQPLPGAAIAALTLAFHLAWTRAWRQEWPLILAAGAFGLVADSMLMRLGLLQFSAGILIPGLAPYWMVVLWMSFATVLNHSLRWLKTRLFMAAAVGGCAGPLAYFAGHRLGALHMPRVTAALGAIALVWMLALPFLLWLSNRPGRVRSNHRLGQGLS